MTVQLPKYLKPAYFYQFLTKRLVDFSHNEDDNVLVLDCRNTAYIQPDVLCTILCYFKYLKAIKPESTIWMVFGSSKTLTMFLSETRFDLYAKIGTEVLSDAIIDGRTLDGNGSCRVNHIQEMSIDNYTDNIKSGMKRKYAIEAYKSLAYNHLQKAFREFYAKASSSVIIPTDDSSNMAAKLAELLTNVAVHSGIDTLGLSHFYYTLQIYNTTGMTIALSDMGKGLYQSLVEQYKRKESNAMSDVSDKIENPHVFTFSELLGFANNKYQRSLSAILESICYRIEQINLFGITYVIDYFLCKEHGGLECTVEIHSDSVSFTLDRELVDELFFTEAKPTKRIINIKKDAFRTLFFSHNHQSNVTYYQSEFPGVHISIRCRNAARRGIVVR